MLDRPDHPPPETFDPDLHPVWLVPALSAGVIVLGLWSAEPLARAWWARGPGAPVDFVLDTRFESPLPRPATSGRPLVFPVYGDAQVVWGIDHLRLFPLPDPTTPGEGSTCPAPTLRPERVWMGWPHQASEAHLMEANAHRGYDIAALQGAPVLAAHEGMAIVTVRRGRCSRATSIGHVNSKGERARRWDWVDEVQVVDWWSRLELTSSYHNLDRVLVRSGDRVKAGEMIGTVGKTGCATWPHLHFEIEGMIDGEDYRLDPMPWSYEAPDPLLAGYPGDVDAMPRFVSWPEPKAGFMPPGPPSNPTEDYEVEEDRRYSARGIRSRTTSKGGTLRSTLSAH